ncbi:hypothetical protein [Desulfurococcus mucosus]|uniref:Uncharacterized protein n=1 Tax=Desulfurococcus mucosus (strain ATCC 35584 / DSM 2162 / JCM 9187 / O7/1) TaxID=765177 RepID=E8R8C9_DESM0|nr:hypothetical protein [Desulfurococcus mucosus]ADV64755.1 hypothetical protein Desmu_0439 [Desulfurococcus mucosus DSM 2162]
MEEIRERVNGRKWAWIISHLDYDHFSIIEALWRDGRINPPDVVILPASYNVKLCRDAVSYLYAYMMLLSHIEKIQPPGWIEIFDRLSNTRKLFVEKGHRIKAGPLEYLVLWPSRDYAEQNCEKVLKEPVLKELKDKIESFCGAHENKEYKNIADKAREEACKEAEKAREKILEGLSKNTVQVYGNIIDLEELLTEDRNRDSYPQREGSRKPENDVASKDKASIILYSKVRNLNSIAYVLKAGFPCELRVFERVKRRKYSVFFDYYYGYDVLLYLGDLSDEELDKALENYFGLTENKRLLVEVAPHHGNSYSRYLKQLNPAPVYLSRCNKHYRYPNRYEKYYHGSVVIVSGHTRGVDISYYKV